LYVQRWLDQERPSAVFFPSSWRTTMSTGLFPSRRLLRSFTFIFGLIAVAASPRVLAADDGCGCLETCRQTFGGLRYAKNTLMLLSSCWIDGPSTYCVYTEWS
jgi:hypothetical protein